MTSIRAASALALALTLCSCNSTQPAPDARATVDARAEARVDAPPADVRVDARSNSERGACKLVKPYSTKNALCNGCAEDKCCVEMNSCLGDSACDDDYVNCILACALTPAPDAGTSPCLAQCAKDYPKGKAEYDAATGCADSKCAAECK